MSTFDHADLMLRVSLISRIAAQFTHEVGYGMWNPDYCSSDAGDAADCFIEAIMPCVEQIKKKTGRLRDDVTPVDVTDVLTGGTVAAKRKLA